MLLGIENDLEAYVNRRVDVASFSSGADAKNEDTQAIAENQRVITSLVNESLKNIALVKDAFLNFIESEGSLSNIQAVPDVLKELAGAMFVSPLDGAESIISELHHYFSDTLITKRHHPDEMEQDAVADVVTNIECFLEAVAENRVDSELYVAAAREALSSLRKLSAGEGRKRKPAIRSEAIEELGSDLQALADELKPEFMDVDSDIDEGVIVEDVDVPAGKRRGTDVPIGRLKAVKDYSELQIIGDDEDEEIIEVFIEEALEELEKISALFPAWRDNAADKEAVTTIRRSFHTLKGSGRLIGATLIGEFSWAIENMMNRLIDGTIKESPALFGVVEETIGVLPQLIEQIRGNRQPIDNIFELMERADAISINQVDDLDESPTSRASDTQKKKDNSARAEELDFVGIEIDYDNRLDDMDTVIGIDADGDEEETNIAFSIDDLMGDDGENADEDLSETAIASPGALQVDEIELESLDVAPQLPKEDLTSEYLSIVADPVLLDIFSDEAESHLVEIERIVEKARQGSVSSKNLESLIRALHTLHGSSRTAKFVVIAGKAKVLEQIANNLAELGRPWGEDELDLLSDAVQYIRSCISHLKEYTSELADDQKLGKRLAEILENTEEDLRYIREKKLEATGFLEPIEIDSELVEIFLEEAPEIIGTIEQEMLAWKNSQYHSRHVTEIMRQLHTLKGSARMASLTDLGDISHSLESVMTSIAAGKLMPTPALADELAGAADRLLGMMDLLAQGRVPTVSQEYLQHLEDIRTGKSQPGAKRDVTGSHARKTEIPAHTKTTARGAEKQVSVLASSGELAAGAVSKAKVVPLEHDRELEAVGDQGGGIQQQEQIRVRADKLDVLVNFAGEANIYHSRLGQYVNDITFNIGELDQTVARLHRQLRDMEIQTEAQIASRMEREAENPYEEFDPLEMDRYSHMQQLSRSLGESASDLDNIKGTLSELLSNSEVLLQQQARIGTELQEELLQTRMVKFQGLASRLRRVVRQTALQLDKKVELELVGADNEIDRSVQERMLAPLEHMLRNAVFHGIESRGERLEVGKPEYGVVRIEIDRDGSYIVMNVIDDGRGIDANRIRKKAIQLGLMEPDEVKSDQEVIQFILSDGFSTAETISQIAGRGVGMDVVDNEIKQLGGSLTITSEPGHGTMFHIRLPLTLAINQALLVQLADDVYAIPLVSIEGVALLGAREIEENLIGRRKDYEYGGYTYDMYYLGALLGLGVPASLAQETRYPLLMIRSGQRRIGVHVDAMLGRREIVVKPVGPQITAVPGISGATILADGRVALILDIAGLMRVEASATNTTIRPQRTTLPFNKPDEEITVMVVDDSITIRKVTARILSRHNLRVITAKDGLDAVQQLQS
jgi:chemosensory pili system protein ChpA (sensor histidine kinase/response regulator)